VLAVPLGVADKVFGIIYADSPIAEGRFTEDHLKVLTTLASVGSDTRRERAAGRSTTRARAFRARVGRSPSEIQQRFQPTAPPHVNGYELQGISFPCYENRW
jgi:GAF domain-containing protein